MMIVIEGFIEIFSRFSLMFEDGNEHYGKSNQGHDHGANAEFCMKGNVAGIGSV